MKKLLVLAAGLVILVPCVYGQEDSEVYAAIFRGSFRASKPLVVCTRTAEPRRGQMPVELLEQNSGIRLDKALQDRYVALNMRPAAVEYLYDEGLNIQMISPEGLEEIFQNGAGWELFGEQYGKACYVLLSRVAFNDACDRAVAYMETHCGPKESQGAYYLLKKDGGAWEVAARIKAWVS